MRGKRKRDWPQRVFCYAVNIHEVEIDGVRRIPPVILAAAHQMRKLWNVAVGAHERLRTEAKDKSNEERKEIFGRLYSEVYPSLAASWLPSTFYKFTWKQFQNAQEAFAKGIRGAPKPHHRLEKIILPHVDASGGKPVAYLDELRKSKPYYLRNGQSGKHLARGFITVNDDRIWFDAIIHRPLPEGAIIKSFALVGRKVNPFGWQWELQIIVEIPSQVLPGADESKWIAIDLGWRVRENGLRVAYWLDYKGDHGEFILPFKCENYGIRRRREFLEGLGDAYMPIADWRDWAERQSEADKYLDSVKDRIRAISTNGAAPAIYDLCQPRKYHFYQRPDGAEFRRNAPYTDADLEEKEKRKTFKYLGVREVDGLCMMRGGSLKKLAADLGDQAPACLVEWVRDSAIDFKRLRAARLRMEGAREHYYRNQCIEWATRYDCLRHESDLNLKALAEAEDQDYPLKPSQKYRQEMASLSLFKSWLEDAFRKRGKSVKRLMAAHTTQTCPECGANMECGPKLIVKCECGAQLDQDFAACRNLGRGDWPEVRAKQQVKREKKEVAE